MSDKEARKSLALTRTRTLERAQGNAVPIEFRTLSIHVAETHHSGRSPAENGADAQAANEANYFANLDFHALPLAQIRLRFNTDETTGLVPTEAARRLKEHGPNTLLTKRPNYFLKILGYVFGGFCSVLCWCGNFLCLLATTAVPDCESNQSRSGHFGSGFAAFQDYSTAQVMKSILDMIPAECTVIRNGEPSKIPASELVIGDVVSLALGNKVPADLRLFQVSSDAKFDRAVLTGESEAVEGATESDEASYLEAKNIAYMGTNLIEGNCRGVVVLKGNDTLMGRINTLTSGRKEKVTIITKEINRFVTIICCMTVLLAGLIALVWGVFIRPNYPDFMPPVVLLVTLMGCVVAFIPEGMPACVSLTLLMIAKRMRDNHILPKALTTVETLGSVNVFCSDKTGTLTENKMVVTTFAFLDMETTPEIAKAAFAGENSQTGGEEKGSLSGSQVLAMTQIQAAALLCNNAKFDPSTLGKPVADRTIFGDATDSALLRFSNILSETSTMSNAFERTFEIPFNSRNKWAMTVYQGSQANPQYIKSLFGAHMKAASNDSSLNLDSKESMLVLVKGAPDVLIPYCTSYLSSTSNDSLPLSATDRDQLTRIQTSWSRQGQRVLMLCKGRFDGAQFLSNGGSSNAIQQELIQQGLRDLCIIGLVGIMDPPRLDIKTTISECRRAGSRFFMITGDFGLTAAAIGKQIGLLTCQGEPHTYDHIMSPTFDQELDPLPAFEIGRPQFRKGTSLVLSGADLLKMSPGEWDQVCAYEEIVFARTSPEQKLKIVQEFQRHEAVVAVTGDGVNDAPALKAADVGIAVVTGSDVAIEAADLILMGEFSSIVQAIRLARVVFENLQKVISYLLPAGSWSEIWPVLINTFLGTPLSLSSFLMIIICCFTDFFPATAMIMEMEEYDLLSRQPRNAKKEHLITLRIYLQSYLFIGSLMTFFSNMMFYLYIYEYTNLSWYDLVLTFGKIDYTKASVSEYDFNNVYLPVGTCVTFVTLVILQWGNVLSIRNRYMSIVVADPFRAKRRNLYLFGGMLASLAVAILVTEVPAIQTLMITGSVPIKYWLLPFPCALAIIVADEVRKVVVRTYPNSIVAKVAW